MFALGVVLVLTAILLVLAEAHLTSGGLIAGVAAVALVGGVTSLLVAAHAGVLAIVLVALAIAALSIGALALLVRSLRSVQRLRPRAGADAMVGHVGVMRVDETAARVFIDGALWRAQPSPLEEDDALHTGDRVVVDQVHGLTLAVRRAEEWELRP